MGTLPPRSFQSSCQSRCSGTGLQSTLLARGGFMEEVALEWSWEVKDIHRESQGRGNLGWGCIG